MCFEWKKRMKLFYLLFYAVGLEWFRYETALSLYEYTAQIKLSVESRY